MAENHSNESPHARSIGRRIIYSLLVVLLGCVGACALCYNSFTGNSFRANLVAWIVEGRVERIYEQTRKAAPKSVTLIKEEKPHSGTYAWGLSQGSDRYATVHAQQTYRTTTAFSDVVAAYQAKFAAWGWDTLPVSGETDLIGIVFRNPTDEDLLAGLCVPVEPFPSAGYLRFVIFFDFDETQGCEGTRLYCIAARYCN